jgi:hypothetical protein
VERVDDFFACHCEARSDEAIHLDCHGWLRRPRNDKQEVHQQRSEESTDAPAPSGIFRCAADERRMGLAKDTKETKKALRLLLILRETNSEDWVVMAGAREFLIPCPCQNDRSWASGILKTIP